MSAPAEIAKVQAKRADRPGYEFFIPGETLRSSTKDFPLPEGATEHGVWIRMVDLTVGDVMGALDKASSAAAAGIKQVLVSMQAWQVASWKEGDCSACGGSGAAEGEDGGEVACPSCGGDGKRRELQSPAPDAWAIFPFNRKESVANALGVKAFNLVVDAQARATTPTREHLDASRDSFRVTG